MVDCLEPFWPAPKRVRALVTTRRGGVSTGPWGSLNLATHVGDDPVAVAHNRALLRRELGLPAEPVWLEQVHGTQVVALGAGSPQDLAPPVADAAWTSVAGRVCAVLTADCLPVLLCTADGGAVAAAHAGWRGLAAGVLRTTVAALAVAPSQVLAYLGPAIGPAAFEVGAEVLDIFVANAIDSGHARAVPSCFVASAPGKYRADIYALARAELAALGVTAVYGGDHCTVAEADTFFSYRRDGITGRMASLVWLDEVGSSY